MADWTRPDARFRGAERWRQRGPLEWKPGMKRHECRVSKRREQGAQGAWGGRKPGCFFDPEYGQHFGGRLLKARGESKWGRRGEPGGLCRPVSEGGRSRRDPVCGGFRIRPGEAGWRRIQPEGCPERVGEASLTFLKKGGVPILHGSEGASSGAGSVAAFTKKTLSVRVASINQTAPSVGRVLRYSAGCQTRGCFGRPDE